MILALLEYITEIKYMYDLGYERVNIVLCSNLHMSWMINNCQDFFLQGNYEEMMKRYKQLLTYIKVRLELGFLKFILKNLFTQGVPKKLLSPLEPLINCYHH